jgi:hypothetical protein
MFGKISVIVCILLIYSCTYTDDNTDLNQMHLRGTVKSIEEFSYLRMKSNPKKVAKILVSKLIFNKSGFIWAEYDYIGKNNYKGKTIYAYDKDNKLRSKKSFDQEGNPKWMQVYNYIAEDSMMYMVLVSPGKLILNTTTYRFVNNRVLNPIGESKFQFRDQTYNSKGLVIETKLFENSTPSGSYQYRYNSNNQIETCVWYDAKNNHIFTENYFYDEYKNLLYIKGILPSGKEKFTKKIFYEYDTKKNWTKKKEYYNNKLVEITSRDIEYY